MGAVIRIAIGNLWEHRSKTLILGFMVMIGMAVIIMGNAFLEATRRNIENDFRVNYTGDVVIHGPSEDTVTLFGIQKMVNTSLPPPLPALPDTKAVLALVRENPEVRAATPLISSLAIAVAENIPPEWEPPADTSSNPFFYLFSGDPSSYWDVFPGHTITEGTVPAANTPEVMLDNRTKRNFEKYYGVPLEVGDKIILQGFSSGMTLREATVCGFYEPANEDTAMMALGFTDPSTARTFADLTFGSAYARELPPSADTAISELSEDELFGGDGDMFSVQSGEATSGGFTDASVDAILGDTSLRDKLNQTDDGAWNFVLIKLKDPAQAASVIAELNEAFRKAGMAVTAMDWKTAASAFAASTDMLSQMFSFLIGVLAVVVFIIMMNTLVVSIMERTAEIGTMRAMGARRGFIRGMFLAESVSITSIAGAAGIILSFIGIAVVNALHITIDGDTARLLLGGGSIGMIPTFTSIITTFLVVLAGSAAANLYPVAVALKITPLQAMNRDQ